MRAEELPSPRVAATPSLGSAGSRDSATAGKPSVSTFTSRTWTTVIGAPRPASTATAKSATSPRFAESRNATNLRTLSRDPPSLADAADDGREVVVGEHDVGGLACGLGAGPAHRDAASARRSAGASLTPSPVTATTSPRAWSSSTIASLSAGVMRAWTWSRRGRARRAIARAVAGWSPVSILTPMPAARARAIASAAVARSGSWSATRPSCSSSPRRRPRPSAASMRPRRRRAREALRPPRLARRSPARAVGEPALERATSGAPLTRRARPAGLARRRRVIRRLTGSKGTSSTSRAAGAGRSSTPALEAASRIARRPGRRRPAPRPPRAAPPRTRARPLRGRPLAGAGGRRDRGDTQLVLRQRAGLVGADDGRRAERLDRREAAHDRAPVGHRARAERERDRHRGGEPSGHGRDRDRHADEERLAQRLALERHRRRSARP